ncbi:hypothetical protein WEU32_10270 [Brevundimonas sp. BH3]|uniref:hypothetical protein n=1 Tax=Brevundimonas sp. BH3 TaxID=3133089 RepID=UPI003243C7D8
MDDEGKVLDVIVYRRLDAEAALKLIRRLLRNRPVASDLVAVNVKAPYYER